jgi:hypothetical protein
MTVLGKTPNIKLSFYPELKITVLGIRGILYFSF